MQCKRHRFDPWVRKICLRRKQQSTPVFLPGKSHREKSLVGYSPWGLKELNMTKHINSIIKPELEKERKKNKIQIPPNNKFTLYNF